MATVNEFAKLVVNVDSRQLDELKKKYKELSGSFAPIKVGIDTSGAKAQIDSFKKAIADELSKNPIKVPVTADVAKQAAPAIQPTQPVRQPVSPITTSRDMETATKAAKSAQAAMEAYAASQLKAVTSSKSLSAELQKNNNGVSLLTSSVSSLSSALAAGFSIREIVNLSDAWQMAYNRINLVTSSSLETKQALNEVYRIAQVTSQSIGATATVYQKFYGVSKQLNLSQEQLSRAVESVQKAVAISGSTSKSAEAAIYQLSQGLAAGALRGQEYNSVNEQANGIIQALSVGLGKTTGQLREMANEGQITSEVFFKGIQAAQSWVDEGFGSQIKTISQGIQQLETAFTKFVGSLSQTTGAGQGAYTILKDLAEVFDSLGQNAQLVADVIEGVAVVAIARLAVAMLAPIGAFLQQARATALASVELQKNAAIEMEVATAAYAAATAKVKQVQSDGQLVVSTQAVTAALAEQAIAQNAVAIAAQRSAAANAAASTIAGTAAARVGGILSGLVGGLPGLAVTLGLTAAYFLTFGNEVEDTSKKAEEASKKFDKLVVSLLKLRGIENLSTASFEQIKTALEKVNQDYEAASKELDKLNTKRSELNAKLEELKLDPKADIESLSTAQQQASQNAYTELQKLNGEIKKQQELVGQLGAQSARLAAEQKNARFAEENATDKAIKALDKRLEKYRSISNYERVLRSLREKNADLESEASKRALEAASQADATIALDKQINGLEKLVERLNNAKIKQAANNEEERVAQELAAEGIKLNTEFAQAVLNKARAIDKANAAQKQIGDLEEKRKQLTQDSANVEKKYADTMYEIFNQLSNDEASYTKAKQYAVDARIALDNKQYESARALAEKSRKVIETLTKDQRIDLTGDVQKQVNSLTQLEQSLDQVQIKQTSANKVEEVYQKLAQNGISKTTQYAQALIGKAKAIDKAVAIQKQMNDLEQKRSGLDSKAEQETQKYSEAIYGARDKLAKQAASTRKADQYASDAKKATAKGDYELARDLADKSLKVVQELQDAGRISESEAVSRIKKLQEISGASIDAEREALTLRIQELEALLKPLQEAATVEIKTVLTPEAIAEVVQGGKTLSQALDTAFSPFKQTVSIEAFKPMLEGLKSIEQEAIKLQQSGLTDQINALKESLQGLQMIANQDLNFKVGEIDLKSIVTQATTLSDVLNKLYGGQTQQEQQAPKVNVEATLDESKLQQQIKNIQSTPVPPIPVSTELDPSSSEQLKNDAAAVAAQAAQVVTFKAVLDTSAIPNGAMPATQAADSIPQFATGGLITGSGTGTSDSVLARVSNGEYVMNAQATKSLGVDFLDKLNSGQIPRASSGQSLGSVNLNIGGESFGLLAQQDQFDRILRKTALKHGRTRA